MLPIGPGIVWPGRVTDMRYTTTRFPGPNGASPIRSGKSSDSAWPIERWSIGVEAHDGYERIVRRLLGLACVLGPALYLVGNQAVEVVGGLFTWMR